MTAEQLLDAVASAERERAASPGAHDIIGAVATPGVQRSLCRLSLCACPQAMLQLVSGRSRACMVRWKLQHAA